MPVLRAPAARTSPVTKKRIGDAAKRPKVTGGNAEQVQSRLGDDFYEQRLINEQVAQLTARRFLVGYQRRENGENAGETG